VSGLVRATRTHITFSHDYYQERGSIKRPFEEFKKVLLIDPSYVKL